MMFTHLRIRLFGFWLAGDSVHRCAAESRKSHWFHHPNPDLLPRPPLFALLKSNQAQLCNFTAPCLPTDAEHHRQLWRKWIREPLRVSPAAREESFCSNLVENVRTHRGALYNQHTDGFSLFIVVTKLIHAQKSINVHRFALQGHMIRCNNRKTTRPLYNVQRIFF